jgi:hypothetical protein
MNAQGHIARVLTRQETLVSALYPFSNFNTVICISLRQTSILLFTLVIISNITTGDQKALDIHYKNLTLSKEWKTIRYALQGKLYEVCFHRGFVVYPIYLYAYLWCRS